MFAELSPILVNLSSFLIPLPPESLGWQGLNKDPEKWCWLQAQRERETERVTTMVGQAWWVFKVPCPKPFLVFLHPNLSQGMNFPLLCLFCMNSQSPGEKALSKCFTVRKVGTSIIQSTEASLSDYVLERRVWRARPQKGQLWGGLRRAGKEKQVSLAKGYRRRSWELPKGKLPVFRCPQISLRGSCRKKPRGSREAADRWPEPPTSASRAIASTAFFFFRPGQSSQALGPDRSEFKSSSTAYYHFDRKRLLNFSEPLSSVNGITTIYLPKLVYRLFIHEMSI